MSKRFREVKYVKLACGLGLASLLGLIGYEGYWTHRRLSTLINTRVLELHRKGPDYIYIEHRIFKKSLKQDLEDYQPLGWKKFKHSLAIRLLGMAQAGDHQQRLKAVYQLALIDHLKDWDFQHLAQMCDPRTAVALARSECDLRWFLLPPRYGLKKPLFEISSHIRAILQTMTQSVCIEHALENGLLLYQEKDPEGDVVSDGLRLTKHESEVLQQTLDALLHLTTTEGFCKEFLDRRGLETLVDLEKLEHDDVNMRLTLCRIAANVTESGDFAYHFFSTGLLSLLARWARDEDMRIQVTASLALANLDKEDDFDVVYPSKVYPLYPKNERKDQPKVDVIFIHGLLGGVFITWRQKKSMLPEVSSITNSKANVVVPKTVKKSSLFPNLMPMIEKKVLKQVSAPDPKTEPETEKPVEASNETMKAMKHEDDEESKMFDTPTQEIIKALKEDEGIGADWEVVFHDVPQGGANENAAYSVSGNEWLNEENRDEYTYCWPMEWLPQDFPNARILGLNYDSSLTQWYGTHCVCQRNSGKLSERAKDFLQKISRAGVGTRPIVWIGHSMGGLLIKSILVQSSQHPDPHIREVAQKTRGIIFLGTPHKGSPVARLKGTSAIVWPSIEVQELKEDAPELLRLNTQFLELIRGLDLPLEIASLCEGRPTIMTSLFKVPFLIVTQTSAQFEEGEFYLTTDDHLGLSKPMCRQSFLYQRLSRMIENAGRTKESLLEDEGREKRAKMRAEEHFYHMVFNFG